MTTSTLSQDALSFVCDLVRCRSAIELDASKAYLIDARLGPVAKRCGFQSTAEFVQGVRAKKQPGLESSLVEALTTNETSFFRDIHPFEALRTEILPNLIGKLAKERRLRIWSAACSTGQELYSVAMLIKEHFPQLNTFDVQLLGTDLSDEVLRKASEGRYTQIEVNRGLTAKSLVRFFQRDGMHWQISPEIRSMASFRKINLIEPWVGIPPMDVIFLRNVLIYL